jgi:ABC-type glycerol-3-phosphate transport system substrate-binding protein
MLKNEARNTVLTILLAAAVLASALGCAQDQPDTKRKLYIQAPPDAQAMKEEIVKKVAAWNGVSIVTLPEKSDLVLEVVQSGKLNVMTGAGDKGAAVLKDAHSGEDLWSDSRGGAWSMRGWSNRAVGRKLGSKLVEFLQVYVNKTPPTK